MKVLMIGSDLSVKGGITSVINQLIAHDWKQEGIEMNFIPSYIEANAVKKMLFFANAYRKIKTELKKNKPDAVHIHMSYKGSFARKCLIHKLCAKYGVKDVIHLHGSEFQKWYDESSEKLKAKIRTLLRECGAMIVLGEAWNERIKTIEPKTNTVVVNNTVHIPADVAHWDKECLRVLFLGVLIKRKGVENLLEAIALLKKRGTISKTKFLIAGTGEEEAFLKKKAKDLGIENSVEFLGWTTGDEKEKLLKECQVLVLPSYNEGLPVAVLEAISYGLPVIATRVGDMETAVKDGYNGLLTDPGDVEGLANAIERLKDETVYTAFGANARTLAESRFSDEHYFSTLAKLYNEIAES